MHLFFFFGDLGIEMIIDLLKGVEDLHEDRGEHNRAIEVIWARCLSFV